MLSADVLEDIQATARGEVGSEHADVGPVLGQLREQLRRRRRQGRHNESAPGQRRGKRLDEQTVRIGQHKLHGPPPAQPARRLRSFPSQQRKAE
jgi:hypothetical protein